MRWALLILAGCGKLLSFSPVDYVPDAPLTRVTGDYQYMYPTVGSDLMPSLLELPAPADTEMVAMLPDGTPLSVDRADDGSFAFSLPVGSSYRFAFRDSDESVAQEYQSDVPNLTLRRRFYNRPDGVLPVHSTPVMVTETGAAASGDFAELASFGVRAFVYSQDVSNVSTDWAVSGVGLLSAAHNDRMIYEHWQLTAAQPSYLAIVDDDVIPVEMMDGTQTTVGPNTPMSLTPDRCIHLHANALAELARLTTATTEQPFTVWELYSIPLAVLGPGGFEPVAEITSSAPSDYDRDIVYGSPFRGEAEVSLVEIGALRPIVVPGTNQTTLEPVIHLYDLLSPQPTCTGAVVDTTAAPLALLATATLNTQALTDDRDAVTIDRTAPAQLAYTLTPGAADVVVVSLQEASVVVVGGYNTTAVVTLRDYIGASPIAIDPSLFVRDHYYLFRVQAIRGFPDHAQLDFRSLTFPFGNATTYSTMFRVAN